MFLIPALIFGIFVYGTFTVSHEKPMEVPTEQTHDP